jgi:hypothetical protein
MASVYQVYSTLKNLANKDEKGFVTPQNFNTFAPIAQTAVFNKILEAIAISKAKRASTQGDANVFSDQSALKQDISTLVEFVNLVTAATGSADVTRAGVTGRSWNKTAFTGGIYDISRIISVFVNSTQRVSQPGELLFDATKLQRILSNQLCKPNIYSPIVFYGDNIEVYPKSGVLDEGTAVDIESIDVSYYRIPRGKSPTTGSPVLSNPRFGYTLTGTKEIYAAASSVDFELPDRYVPVLVLEIAKMIGVNLSDADIYNYANQPDNNNV